MVKLLKYELIRSKNILCISLVTLLCIEVLFLFGFFFNNESALGTATTLLVFAGIGGFLAIIIYAVNRFYTDLKNKYGYMLFLTPRNAYQIVGSKVINSFLVMMIGFALYVGVVVLDISLAFNAAEESNMLVLMFESIFAEFDWSIWLVPLEYIIGWFNMILTIYFAIALTFTFLSNSKHKGWMAVLIYLGLNIAISTVTSAIMTPVMSNLLNSMENMEVASYTEYMASGGLAYMAGAILLELVIAVVMYFATSLLLEKKLNL